jgi:hypothetical protein
LLSLYLPLLDTRTRYGASQDTVLSVPAGSN